MRYVIYIISSVVIIVILWVIYLVVMTSYKNHAALSRAEAFCDSIKIGDPVDSHFPPRDEFNLDAWTTYDSDNAYGVIFFGHMFDEAICDVKFRDGKVKSVRVHMVYD